MVRHGVRRTARRSSRVVRVLPGHALEAPFATFDISSLLSQMKREDTWRAAKAQCRHPGEGSRPACSARGDAPGLDDRFQRNGGTRGASGDRRTCEAECQTPCFDAGGRLCRPSPGGRRAWPRGLGGLFPLVGNDRQDTELAQEVGGRCRVALKEREGCCGKRRCLAAVAPLRPIGDPGVLVRGVEGMAAPRRTYRRAPRQPPAHGREPQARAQASGAASAASGGGPRPAAPARAPAPFEQGLALRASARSRRGARPPRTPAEPRAVASRGGSRPSKPSSDR